MKEGLSLLVVLTVLILGFGMMSDSFLTSASFSTLANQLPTALTLAVAMTFVLVVGEIDLSIGSVLAVSGAVLGIAMAQLGWSWPWAIGAALTTGLLAGLVNGFVVVRWRLPSFIVTLGMAGINTSRVKLAIFAMSGLLAGLAAVMQVSRLASADPNAGTGFELNAIAAAVIGGTRLMGGKGSVVNTFFGVVIMGVLATGLSQIGAQDPTKRLVTGCVIVLAVIADLYRERWANKRSVATAEAGS